MDVARLNGPPAGWNWSGATILPEMESKQKEMELLARRVTISGIMLIQAVLLFIRMLFFVTRCKIGIIKATPHREDWREITRLRVYLYRQNLLIQFLKY